MRSPFFPAYSLALLIFIVASLPGSDLQKVQEYPNNLLLRFLLSDPFMHFLTFGILTLLICYGYKRSDQTEKGFQYGKTDSINSLYIRGGLIGIGYSLFIELYQAILPYRTFGLDDLLWNTTGIIIAVLVFIQRGINLSKPAIKLR